MYPGFEVLECVYRRRWGRSPDFMWILYCTYSAGGIIIKMTANVSIGRGLYRHRRSVKHHSKSRVKRHLCIPHEFEIFLALHMVVSPIRITLLVSETDGICIAPNASMRSKYFITGLLPLSSTISYLYDLIVEL